MNEIHQRVFKIWGLINFNTKTLTLWQKDERTNVLRTNERKSENYITPTYFVCRGYNEYLQLYVKCFGGEIKIKEEQEAHRPRFAHLSDIATADMQMLCNIFPILSSQLMKISSSEQFLVLKKNIWAWQSMEHDHLNKLSITFQQKDQCEIWWKLAKWFLKNHDFIHVNSTVAGKYYKYKPDDGHLRFPIWTILTTVDLQVNSIL